MTERKSRPSEPIRSREREKEGQMEGKYQIQRSGKDVQMLMVNFQGNDQWRGMELSVCANKTPRQ